MVELSAPPEVLMGEAGNCSFWAMVAIAHVYQRNSRMNGWRDRPGAKAVLASILWPLLPDPTGGAIFVFSTDDLRQSSIRRIIGGASPRAQFVCDRGGLEFY